MPGPSIFGGNDRRGVGLFEGRGLHRVFRKPPHTKGSCA